MHGCLDLLPEFALFATGEEKSRIFPREWGQIDGEAQRLEDLPPFRFRQLQCATQYFTTLGGRQGSFLGYIDESYNSDAARRTYARDFQRTNSQSSSYPAEPTALGSGNSVPHALSIGKKGSPGPRTRLS